MAKAALAPLPALAAALEAVFYRRTPKQYGPPAAAAGEVLEQLGAQYHLTRVGERPDETERLLRAVHQFYTWQGGGDHPNTVSLRKCGTCERLRVLAQTVVVPSDD